MPLPVPPGLEDHAVFRTLFTAYPDSLLVADGSGTIVLANPAAARLLGYTVDELVGLPVDVLVPDAIRPRHAAYRAQYMQAPRARPMGTTQTELVARRRDGSEVMVEIALSPLQEHGLPYVVAAIRGIADFPRVKQALQRARYAEHVAQFGRFAVDAREPQALLEQAAHTAQQALQAESAVVYLLEGNGREFRIAAGIGLAGETVGARLPNRPDTPPGHALLQGRPVAIADYRQETRFRVPAEFIEAGRRSGLAVPLSDRGRSVGVLTVRSNELQRFGEDEMRFVDALASLLATSLQRVHSEEALHHSQRLESVGQLTGGIAHDFNNLLTVISGNLQVLEDLPAVAGDAFGQQLVAAASRATRRAAELTSKLLAFSRRQVLQPTVVDVTAMLESLTDMLRRTLDQRIEITLEAPPDCPPCSADASQLESALLNIAINARDAMPEGGRLAFACRPVPVWPQLRAELGNGDTRYVAISVGDSGTGMPEAVKERAFEPFFTTKEAGRGTGLGLSTVYGFAKQSRGTVTIDSTPGAGTTITLYLPAVEDEADDDAAATVTAAGGVPPGLRVLMVEDDPEVRSVVHRFLVALGCEVLTAVNGEDALLLLDSEPGVDLLLTDIALGAGMRGTELARQAQQRRPRLPVLLMSGFASGLLDAPPGWDLLRKPYTRDDLCRAIVRAVSPGGAAGVPG